jgi:hypothetical protein
MGGFAEKPKYQDIQIIDRDIHEGLNMQQHGVKVHICLNYLVNKHLKNIDRTFEP